MTLDNIGAICQARGVAKVSPQKAAEAKEDIIFLEDIGQLFNLFAASETMREKISEQGLTTEANSLYSGAFAGIRESDPLKRTLLAVDATLEAIDAIKSGRKRNALANDRKALNKIKEIILTTQNTYSITLNKLSPVIPVLLMLGKQYIPPSGYGQSIIPVLFNPDTINSLHLMRRFILLEVIFSLFCSAAIAPLCINTGRQE